MIDQDYEYYSSFFLTLQLSTYNSNEFTIWLRSAKAFPRKSKPYSDWRRRTNERCPFRQ